MLGAILAGGKSSRFGSDKALAVIGGRTLMEHTIAALAPQVDHIVICGRSWPGCFFLSDHPVGGLGPLGGLNAALLHAKHEGFDAVLSVSVDSFPLPNDLAIRLRGQGAQVFEGQHLIGCWPSSLSGMLDTHLAKGARSIRSWIDVCGAGSVSERDLDLRNLNTLEDMALVSRKARMSRAADREQ